jgi:DNA-binding transcriptional MerR regulator
MSMEIDMPERVEDASTDPPVPAAESPIEQPAAPVQDSLPGTEPPPSPEAPPKPEPKSLTIGAVCKSLEREFPDISISKIRYLEDQKLLTPRRTRGGYRLYSPADADRLRTILRLQRDEFLPLRVIRQELASGRADAGDISERRIPGSAPDPRALRRATLTVKSVGSPLYRLADVLEETGASAALVKELEDYGVVKGERRDGEQFYDDTEREIIRAVAELARFGVGGRNLRVFRTSADREAALLEQILAPSLRSRNPERRREAVDQLENLAAIASHLKYLLLVRDLRKITS